MVEFVREKRLNNLQKMKLFDIFVLSNDKLKLIEFLKDKGILRFHNSCEICGKIMSFSMKELCYRCYSSTSSVNDNETLIKRCNTKISCIKGSFFERTKLDLCVLFRLLSLYLIFEKITLKNLASETNVSIKTIRQWINKINSILTVWVDVLLGEKLGGEGEVVEVDETFIGHRKYNRGRVTKTKWIVGLFERSSKKVLFFPVEDRCKKTLHALITKHVKVGTNVYTDGWRGYCGLSLLGFNHQRVNHKYQFVNSRNRQINTQNIERVWRDLKETLPRYGNRKKYQKSKLSKFIFSRLFKYHERVEAFLAILSVLHNPN